MQPQLLCVHRPCDYCGATLEISAAQLAGQSRAHPYVCPECRKTGAIDCAGHPHVRVLGHRTDGKTSSYQDTMF